MAAIIFASRLNGNLGILSQLEDLGASSQIIESTIIIALPKGTIEGVKSELSIEWGDDMLLVTRSHYLLPTGLALFVEKIESLQTIKPASTQVHINAHAMNLIAKGEHRTRDTSNDDVSPYKLDEEWF